MFRDSAFKKKLFVYGSAASLMCYAGSLSYAASGGLLFVVVLGLLTVVEHRL